MKYTVTDALANSIIDCLFVVWFIRGPRWVFSVETLVHSAPAHQPSVSIQWVLFCLRPTACVGYVLSIGKQRFEIMISIQQRRSVGTFHSTHQRRPRSPQLSDKPHLERPVRKLPLLLSYASVLHFGPKWKQSVINVLQVNLCLRTASVADTMVRKPELAP